MNTVLKVEPSRHCSYHPVYGEALGVREVGGFMLSETVYSPRLQVPHHTHEQDGYFNFVLQGGYTEYASRKAQEFSPKQLVFHPPGEAHSDRMTSAGARLFNVRFSCHWLRRVSGHAPVLNSSTRFDSGPVPQLAAKLYNEFREGDAFSPLVIEALALEMLAESSRHVSRPAESRAPAWLARAKEMLHAHFNETITMAQIAESAGVHPVHLNRAFRRRFRCTAGEYVRRLRVEYACHLLAHSHAPLAEIASAAGFSDQSHFHRTFKRLTGLTPARYRAMFD